MEKFEASCSTRTRIFPRVPFGTMVLGQSLKDKVARERKALI